MATPTLSFGGEVSQNYDDFLGPFFFEPYAADLANRLDFNGVHKMLELACGTGRLTKHISDILPAMTEFVASDLNPDMIAVAKGKVTSDRVKWATADMLQLPFENESFDLIVCQFGIMLVPDQLKALTEINRVLKIGGKLVFSVWSDLDFNRVWSIGDKVLLSFLGKNRIGLNPGPFALGDQGYTQNLLVDAGFSASKGAIVELPGQIDSAANAAYGFVHGLPVGAFIQTHNAGLMPDILKKMEKDLITELGNHPLVTPQKALVFECIK